MQGSHNVEAGPSQGSGRRMSGGVQSRLRGWTKGGRRMTPGGTLPQVKQEGDP